MMHSLLLFLCNLNKYFLAYLLHIIVLNAIFWRECRKMVALYLSKKYVSLILPFGCGYGSIG